VHHHAAAKRPAAVTAMVTVVAVTERTVPSVAVMAMTTSVGATHRRESENPESNC
jgi:ABC-type proline/glycine betaine transport system permease subunit